MAAFAAGLALVTATSVQAAPDGEGRRQEAAEVGVPDPAARLRQAAARGELTREEALLYRLQLAFDPSALPAQWRPAARSAPASADPAAAGVAGRPAKDLTALVAEFTRGRASLSAGTIALVEKYLGPSSALDAASVVSPSGRFRLEYILEGRHAVPPEDTAPADGVPDYVQRVARYFDRSWKVLVDSLGMAAPALAPTYEVGFEAMDAYGYTIPLGDGRTRIVMHNTYLGFPANDDPEGSRWGAARATAAHEFEHACQYAATRWSEGGWGELDATWAEDIVFDQVNDYVNYLHADSPLSDPGQPLDHGGSGSYPDCLWQHWLSQNHGVQSIGQLWRARRTDPQTAMLESYGEALARAGSSLQESWPLFAAWNWLTGSRAVAGIGYEEAATYPEARPAATVSAYPGSAAGALDHLAAAFVACERLPRSGLLRVRLERGADPDLALTAVMRTTGGAIEIQRLPSRAGGPAEGNLSLPLEELQQVALVVTNAGGGATADGAAWSLEVEALGAEAERPAALPVVLHGSMPNPFNPTTRIEFTLGRDAPVRLEVLDIAGRRVRILFDGDLPAGRHSVVWDGRDASGRPSAGGTYLACLSGDGRRQSRRMTLLR